MAEIRRVGVDRQPIGLHEAPLMDVDSADLCG